MEEERDEESEGEDKDKWFFFFKQKTAYEMLRGLVGSGMCIRDRVLRGWHLWANGW